MDIKSEYNNLIILSYNLNISMQKASESAQKNANKTASAMSTMATGVKKFFSGAIKSAKAIGIDIPGTFVSIAKEGIKMASDLSVAQKKVNTTFGINSDSISKWSKTALKSYGLSELQAKKFSSSIGGMLKSSGITGDYVVKLSKDISGLSGDFASFYNINKQEAFDKISAGISGNVEPLKELGINMSSSNLQAYALSRGFKESYESMDQASQIALRYSYLMEASKNVQGDFARSQGTFTNQSELLQTNLKQLAACVASGVLPMITKLVQSFNNFLSGSGGKSIEIFFKALTDNASSLIPVIEQLLSSIVSIGPPIMGMINQLFPVLLELGKGGLSVIAQLINIVIAVLKPLIPVITMLVINLMPPIMQIINSVILLLESLIPVISFLANIIGASLSNAIIILMPLIDIVSNTISMWINILAELINFITNIFTGNWEAAWMNIVNMFNFLWEGAKTHVKGVLNFIIGMINGGIRSVNKITGFLGSIIGIEIKGIPEIPTFANGGFANRPSIFGEAGLEAAIPIKYKSPRSISLLNQTARAIGAETTTNTGVTVVYSPQIHGVGEYQISSKLKEDFERFKEWAELYFEEKAREAFA